MASRTRFKAQIRDAGGFIALPFSVVDSAAYMGLSVHARALLIEIARQLRGDNNGALLCSRAYMTTRGWKSSDMLTKCKAELLEARLLHQTVMGHRPNKASWYAVTWLGIDKLNGFDHDLARTFERSSYKAKGGPRSTFKNTSLRPPHGTEARLIGPPHGTKGALAVPHHGPMAATSGTLSVPPDGHHLEEPSTVAALGSSN